MAKESKLVPIALLFSFNVFQFSTYVLKVPPLFLLTKGLVVLVVLGGLLRLVRGEMTPRTEESPLKGLLSVESAERMTRAVFNKANFAAVQAKAIVLWKDPVKSLYSLVLLYVLSVVLKVVPSVLVTFLLVWGLFLYVYMHEFLHKNVCRHFEPYAGKFADLLHRLYNTIPRLNEDKLL